MISNGPPPYRRAARPRPRPRAGKRLVAGVRCKVLRQGGLAKGSMVFFNYATMQMAAKIVYYGPGLCGKTTNLHVIYAKTSPKSRGEMVSLETESDRTLFFDLLPIEVGRHRRIQDPAPALHRARPGLLQHDPQARPEGRRRHRLRGRLPAADARGEHREPQEPGDNLPEIGLTLENIPLVLQYNKRDLQNILSIDELNESLNPTASSSTRPPRPTGPASSRRSRRSRSSPCAR